MPRGVKRYPIVLNLEDPDFIEAGVKSFITTAFPQASYGAAMRELVLRGVGGDPLSAALRMARRAAYWNAMREFRMSIAKALQEQTNLAEAACTMANAEYAIMANEIEELKLRIADARGNG